MNIVPIFADPKKEPLVSKHLYIYDEDFQLEAGGILPGLEITYSTFGTLNSDASNAIWVCHALTANSDPVSWWSGLFGDGKLFNPEEHFVVCANILGSCYGTTGPLSINRNTGKPFYDSFPMVTIRDMAKAHILLKNHLGIKKIKMGIGGSMGAYQLMEWTLAEPETFQKLVLMVSSAQESAWCIAVHQAQRLAIEADCTWLTHDPSAGAKGLKTARAFGMVTYRNYDTFVRLQTDSEPKLDNFKASSYINYQGDKLVKRFNAYTYWYLTKAMDSHNISRGRGTIDQTLAKFKPKCLIIGISSDILCPLPEQKHLAENIPGSTFTEIDSPYGHDGFLVEFEQIETCIRKFGI